MDNIKPNPLAYATELREVFHRDIENHPIYVTNRIEALKNALLNNFPYTRELLGKDLFTPLAHAYAYFTPSTHWDINTYGTTFSEFVFAQTNSVKAHMRDWETLSQLAQIEYCIVKLYYDDDHSSGTNFTIIELKGEPNKIMDHLSNLIKHYPFVTYIECIEDEAWTPYGPAKKSLTLKRFLNADGFSMTLGWQTTSGK